MKAINFMFVIALVLMALASADFVQAAEVRSVSREIVQKINGKSVMTVKVTCAEIDRPVVIMQAKRSGPWCSADLREVCSKQKIKAAGKVCGTHFQQSLLEYYASQSESDKDVSNSEQQESETDEDVEIAAVVVPLNTQSDAPATDAQQDADLEKRYEEYVQSIDF